MEKRKKRGEARKRVLLQLALYQFVSCEITNNQLKSDELC